MSWQRCFDDPIRLPGRRELVTLTEAAPTSPNSDHDCSEWQTAMHYLLQAADRGVVAALRKASGIIAEYFEPGGPLMQTKQSPNLIAVLDSQDLARAIERLENSQGLRVVN
jgi:hypothetical protein